MKTLRFLCIALAVMSVAACSKPDGPVPTETVSEDVVPHAMLPETAEPTAYRIDMVINPDDEAFKGVAEIDIILHSDTNKIWLHGKTITVTDATAASGEQVYALEFVELPAAEAPSGIAYLKSEEILPAGQYTLRLPYSTPYNMALNSAYKVTRGEDAYIVTQFEALGAREAFPSFDEPRFKVPFTISISAPNEDVVIANTPAAETEDIGGGWTKHNFATTRPLPTYLIAFAVGPYDVVEHNPLPPTAVRSREIPLRGVAAKGSGDQLKYALENTAGILEALEDYFGISYPYEKLDLIAAPDYAFGAMENPGAIVYREYLLLLGDNAPLSQKRAYARVHSHELAHQWFGNLVTPYWWEDIWLNEAFATWMGNKGTHLWNPEGNFDRLTLNASLGAMNIDTLSTTRKVREPLHRSENVMDQFDGITYRKGGGVLDMFESYVGAEAFQKGVRLHMERYTDGVATADDFFKSIADGSGNPHVVDAMKSFVDQPGLPLVRINVDCGGDENCKKPSLRIQQSRYAPLGSNTQQGQSWKIPLCINAGYSDKVRRTCHLLTAQSDQVNLTLSGRPDWIMPNENGAGYYRFNLDRQSWQSLLASIDKLNAREVLSVQDSLVAAYRAGEVDSSVMIDGMKAFANHPEYDVASKAGDLIGWMYENLPQKSRPDLAQTIQEMYAGRYARIVGNDTVEGELLAPAILQDLIFKADDPALLEKYAGLGAAYLGLDGEPDKSAVAPNMLSNALRASMAVRPADAMAPLMALVKDGSSFEKSAALGALRQSTDMEIAASLRDAALNDTDTFTGRQASTLIFGLLHNPRHRAASWIWFKDNFDTFVETRVPDVRIGSVPTFGSYFCSAEKRDELEAFMTEKADLIPGYERSLAQTLERIDLCAALTDTKGAEMAEALAAAARQ